MVRCLLVLHGRLHAQAPELFEHLLTGGEGNLLQWWDAVAASPDHWYKQHPMVQRQPNAALRIPIGLHRDEAGVHGVQQVLALT